jgi:hypothetical protein
VDAQRFDRLIRTLRTRRSMLGLVAGIGAMLGVGADEATARKCKKPCGPCKSCKKGRCRPRADDTPCGQGGRCLKGRCKSAPLCGAVNARCSDQTCRRGNNGADCLTDNDCISGQCVGYRCQGYVDCTGAPFGTICHTDGGCAFDTCSSCWTEGSSPFTCCKIVAEAKICTSPSQCQAGQCT